MMKHEQWWRKNFTQYSRVAMSRNHTRLVGGFQLFDNGRGVDVLQMGWRSLCFMVRSLASIRIESFDYYGSQNRTTVVAPTYHRSNSTLVRLDKILLPNWFILGGSNNYLIKILNLSSNYTPFLRARHATINPIIRWHDLHCHLLLNPTLLLPQDVCYLQELSISPSIPPCITNSCSLYARDNFLETHPFVWLGRWDVFYVSNFWSNQASCVAKNSLRRWQAQHKHNVKCSTQ